MADAEMPTADIPPNHTVYVNNLNDRIKKDELRKQLYCLFSQFGVILDVVALKTPKMRGQAFVTFRDISSATQAVRSLQGFDFFEKKMRLQYSKHKGNVVKQLEGTYDPRKLAKKKVIEFGKPKDEAGAAGAAGAAAGDGAAEPGGPAAGAGESAADAAARLMPPPPPPPPAAAAGEPDGPPPPPPPPAAPAEPPHRILFVQNLPEQVNEMMLKLLFQQFDGFGEARLVPGKPGIAFVEFASEPEATVAMGALQAFKVTPTHLMQISYAKA